MKTKLTKCLVMGALAIGMSSNVMAKMTEVVKPSHTGKLQPFAFESLDAHGIQGFYFLLDKKGSFTGLSCVTGDIKDLAPTNCSKVSGKAALEDPNLLVFFGYGTKMTAAGQLEETKALVSINLDTKKAQLATYKNIDNVAQASNSLFASAVPVPLVNYSNQGFAMITGLKSTHKVTFPSSTAQAASAKAATNIPPMM